MIQKCYDSLEKQRIVGIVISITNQTKLWKDHRDVNS